MTTKKKRPWNAVLVKAPDGFTYLLGRPAIEDDRAMVSIDLDGESLGHATEKVRDMDDDDMETWFCEQFRDLGFVRDQGTIVTRPTYEQLLKGDRCEHTDDCKITFIKL